MSLLLCQRLDTKIDKLGKNTLISWFRQVNFKPFAFRCNYIIVKIKFFTIKKLKTQMIDN